MSSHVALKRLDALRVKIAEKALERIKVDNAPQSREDVRDGLRRYAERAVSEALRPLAFKLAGIGSGEPPPFIARGLGGAVDLGPLLAVIVGPARLVELLQPVLATLPDGMSTADKRAALRALDAEILALEHLEETVVQDLESQGVGVTRRGDANPAVVLRLAAP